MADGASIDPPAQCKIAGSATCRGVFDRLTYTEVQRHIEEHHGMTLCRVNVDGQAECPWKGCSSRIIPRNMGKHVGEQHLRMSETTCPECACVFKLKSACERHVREQHGPDFVPREFKAYFCRAPRPVASSPCFTPIPAALPRT